MVSTVDHVDYLPEPATIPAEPSLSSSSSAPTATASNVPDVDEERVKAILRGERPKGEPTARSRLAAAIYRITGWEAFSQDDERAYVSRLWAEDWDSSEDSAYDEL